MTRKTHPHQQPAWCEIQHRPDWAIHSAAIGEVVMSDHESVSVEVNDFGDGNGPAVTMHPWILPPADPNIGAVMNGDQSRELADLLADAGDILDGRTVRARHAFTVERTRGDHFVWLCRCGHVIVQDPGFNVLPELVEHATGGAR